MNSKAGGTMRLGGNGLTRDLIRPTATHPTLPLQSPKGLRKAYKKSLPEQAFCVRPLPPNKSAVIFRIRILKSLSKLSIRKSQRFGTGFFGYCRDGLLWVGQQSRLSIEICHDVAKTNLVLFTLAMV